MIKCHLLHIYFVFKTIKNNFIQMEPDEDIFTLFNTETNTFDYIIIKKTYLKKVGDSNNVNQHVNMQKE